MRLLLAEDEKALSKAIVKILEKNNCSVDDRVCEATVKGTDPDNDLAVIAVKKSDIPDETARVIQAAVIGSSDERFRKEGNTWKKRWRSRWAAHRSTRAPAAGATDSDQGGDPDFHYADK